MSFPSVLKLLSEAFETLIRSPEVVIDDTCLLRLLDWIRDSLGDPTRKDALIRAVIDFIQRIEHSMHSTTLSFALKLSAIDSSLCTDECLQWIVNGRLDGHVDATIRCSAFQALKTATTDSKNHTNITRLGLVQLALDGLKDSSLFVGKAAGDFVASWFHTSGILFEDNDASLAIVTGCFEVMSNPHCDPETVKGLLEMVLCLFHQGSLSGKQLLVKTKLLHQVEIFLGFCDGSAALASAVKLLMHLVNNLSDWVGLLDGCSSSVAEVWLMDVSIALLERGFCHYAFQCLVEFFINSNRTSLAIYSSPIIFDMVILPIILFVSGQHKKRSSDSVHMDLWERFRINLLKHLESRTACIQVVTSSFWGIESLAKNENVLDDLPVDSWCLSLAQFLKLTCDIDKPLCNQAWTSYLLGNEKTVKRALRAMQQLCYTKRLSLDSIVILTDTCLSLLSLKASDPQRLCVVLGLLGECIILQTSQEVTCDIDFAGILPPLFVSAFWEVRDSAYELISNTLHNEAASLFLPYCVEVINAVWNGRQDGQSFVRSSALTALGQILIHDKLCDSFLKHCQLDLKDIVGGICSVLVDDTEAFPRRSAIRVFILWLDKKPGFRDCVLQSDSPIQKLILTSVHKAINDFDWEVKKEILEFWMKLISFNEKSVSHEAVSILNATSGMDDLIKATQDHDQVVKEKAVGLLQALAEIEDALAATLQERGVLQEESCNSLLKRDEEAISLLQDILACSASRDECMLLDCY
eukprot:m.195827 g.195827  ORF g.195827 m.195827 type:complete len:752 (+) comp39522_c0_seq4:23-2278(+)